MKTLLDTIARGSHTLPYTLKESPLDPITLVLVAPLLIGYTVVIILGNIL